jgi:F-type H+-transporting ATPase subunit b
MTRFLRNLLLSLAVVLVSVVLYAQQPASAGHTTQPDTHSAQPVNPNTAVQKDLSEASEKAGEGEEKEENGEFKYNKSVMWLAKTAGISREAAFWTFTAINFLILAGAIFAMSRKAVPAALRARRSAIQKGIEDARKASAEANARLSDIEGRLQKLDSEVAELRASADADFSTEQKRIQQAAEQDARHVVESAQQEIETASRTAQRELKKYAADLAVDLAGKKIKVDASTDQALVKGFVGQLGKDGK